MFLGKCSPGTNVDGLPWSLIVPEFQQVFPATNQHLPMQLVVARPPVLQKCPREWCTCQVVVAQPLWYSASLIPKMNTPKQSTNCSAICFYVASRTKIIEKRDQHDPLCAFTIPMIACDSLKSGTFTIKIN